MTGDGLKEIVNYFHTHDWEILHFELRGNGPLIFGGLFRGHLERTRKRL